MRRGGGFLFLGLGLSSVSTFDVSFLKVFLRFQTEENQKKTKENQRKPKKPRRKENHRPSGNKKEKTNPYPLSVSLARL